MDVQTATVLILLTRAPSVCDGAYTAAEQLGHEEFMIDRVISAALAKYHQLCNQFGS